MTMKHFIRKTMLPFELGHTCRDASAQVCRVNSTIWRIPAMSIFYFIQKLFDEPNREGDTLEIGFVMKR